MKTIGIIGAMDEEITSLVNSFKTIKVENETIFKFYISKYNNVKIIVVKSGVGKVNSAISTQIMINKYKVDYVINIGIAGGISKSVKVLDIVLSRETLQYDVDATKFGYELGQIPQLDNYIFKCDDYLLKCAVESLESKYNFHIGRIVSGDKFVSDIKTKEFLEREFDALCADMESGSIGQVCYINKTPYLAIRSISDNADEDSNINYNEFKYKAAENSFKIILNMLNIIGREEK